MSALKSSGSALLTVILDPGYSCAASGLTGSPVGCAVCCLPAPSDTNPPSKPPISIQNQAKNSNDKDVCYFADLPGYGYAKMSKDKQRTIEVSLCCAVDAVPKGCPFRPPLSLPGWRCC